MIGAAPITYNYSFIAPSNTGVPSGFDLDNNGTVGGGNDALGFGAFPGQFGMAFFSQYEILTDQVRTFQTFLWKDMPGARLPDDSATAEPQDWYSPAELAVLPLSSKSHWDIPVTVNGEAREALDHYRQAIDCLLPARFDLWKMGGSRAQRDVIDWTLTEVAVRAGQRDIALSLAHERLGTRPKSVPNRMFLQRAEAIAS